MLSYGGYSAFYLAGIHNNRFKTFIAHDGVFNTQSMFELLRRFLCKLGFWWSLLGKKDNAVAQKTQLLTLRLS
jgi:S-formylglutathione hydrolase FrmB